MVEVLDGAIGAAEGLLKAAVGAMAIWFIIWTWMRTRSLVPVLGALLLGAAVLWGVNNIGFLQNQVNEDVTNFSEGRTGR
jgi:fatty acid desaturase